MDNGVSIQVPEHLTTGTTTNIGSYTFTKEEIKRFASKFDPQRFHLNEEEAEKSVLGGLCASGWHTVSIWMKLQRASIANLNEKLKAQGKPWTEYGPSPGMKHLKWLSPVYAGDTITYSNQVEELRRSKSKPEWWLLKSKMYAENQNGMPVMQFESTVFLKFITD